MNTLKNILDVVLYVNEPNKVMYVVKNLSRHKCNVAICDKESVHDFTGLCQKHFDEFSSPGEKDE